MERSPGAVRVMCHRALRRLAMRFGDATTETEGVLVE
jgi:hypothetical protein